MLKPSRHTDNQSIALVLSGGGAKGYAHIGAIRALEEMEYNITSIAGTSMGALVGGLYAAGKLKEAYHWLKSIGTWDIITLTDLKNISDTGIVDGEYVFSELNKYIGGIRIEDLKIPFSCVATDLLTGQEVVFRSGSLLDAIRASISIPGVFKPYNIAGRRYIDGGVVNGLPINRVVRTEGDKLFAINLDTFGNAAPISVTKHITHSLFRHVSIAKYFSYLIAAFIPGGIVKKVAAVAVAGLINRVWSFVSRENVFTILISAFYISLKQNKQNMLELEKPEMYINIDLQGYDTSNFADAEVIAQIGYVQVRKMLIDLKK